MILGCRIWFSLHSLSVISDKTGNFASRLRKSQRFKIIQDGPLWRALVLWDEAESDCNDVLFQEGDEGIGFSEEFNL